MLLTLAAVFGGVQVVGAFNQLGLPVKLSVSIASTPTSFATKAPVVVDPVVAAQVASGLTAMKYQTLTAQAAKLDVSENSHVFTSQVAQLATLSSKSLVIVRYYHCPVHGDNPTAMTWDISGTFV